MTQRRVTSAQQSLLCDFFEENPEVIRGYKKKPDCVEAVQMKWKKITLQLNSLGPSRDHKSWAKYLCDLKAKLKRKRVVWKQKSDGTGSLLCNADEFSEISLRILQEILKNDSKNESKKLKRKEYDDEYFEADQSLEDSTTITTDTVLTKNSQLESRCEDIPGMNNYEDVSNSQIQEANIFVNQGTTNDEFDTFARNIAQQLRILPLSEALETQELILSILRKKRLQVLSEHGETGIDPLEKH